MRRDEAPVRDDSWAQGLHERDERVHFGRVQILSVGRHVATALQHLANELIARLARRDTVERRAALATLTAEAVAGAALLVLEHERALQLERSAAFDVADRRGRGAPRLHLGRPRDRHPEPGEG